MTCAKARRLISRELDGELRGRDCGALRKHLETCPVCRAFARDLGDIRRAAAGLETPEPSKGVWNRIRTELAAREIGTAGTAVPLGGGLFGRALVRPIASAALALALIGGGVLIGLRLGRQGGGAPAAPSMAESRDFTLAKLTEAETYYQKAIAALDEVYAVQRTGLAPEVAAMFERNLQVIDAAILACRDAVAGEPDSVEAWGYLLAAYRKKMLFLDDALDYRNRPALTGAIG